MILQEFDEDKDAILSPQDIAKPVKRSMPEWVVSCFDRSLFARMICRYGGDQISYLSAANCYMPVYRTEYKGRTAALVNMDCGAPMCASACEELYEMGTEHMILFGTCGILFEDIENCSIIIPTSAVRDEGTSYHYLPASDEIAVNEKYIGDFTRMLEKNGISYKTGKVWTTDAIYRETRAKIERRKAQGCICVDMECSAAAAVAKFRGKDIFHFFYATDYIGGEIWDPRSLSNEESPEEKDRAAACAMELVAWLSWGDNEVYEQGIGTY